MMMMELADPHAEDGGVSSCAAGRQANYSAQITHYGAICVRRRTDTGDLEILLITSRHSGRWVIPKGRPMPNRKPHQVARREAWEEAGIRGVVHKNPCGYFHYRKTLLHGGVAPCLVQVYRLDVVRLTAAFPESDQRRMQWFTPADAAAAVNEPELSAMLLALAADADTAGKP